MKPVESFEAEIAYKEGKPVFILDKDTLELIHINKCKNKNYIINAFVQPYNLFYIYE